MNRPQKAMDKSDSTGNTTLKLCSAKVDIKPDFVCSPYTTLDGTYKCS